MRIYGLTGGIASGKSTVSARLRELGAPVVDADLLAREVVAPGEPGLQEIAMRFPGVLHPDGTLDRSALGRRVFSDPAEREALESIVHPRIRARLAAEAQALAQKGKRYLIYDAALIVENGLHRGMDGLIVVSAPPELQLRRLMARDGLSQEAAAERLAAQLPLEKKLALARWVVDNSGTLEDTHRQVDRIHAELVRDADAG